MAGESNPRQKKIRPLAVVLAALLLAGVILAVVAYYIRRTQPVDSQLTLAKVSCEIRETVNGNEKSAVQVANTGSVPVYIRVRLVSYWQTPSGNIAAKGSVTPQLTEATLGSGWLAAGEDTYYYAQPVASGQSTGNLLASGAPIILQTDEGYIQVVEVLAEAIQAKPVTAVQEAWNVSLNNKGEITNP